MKKRNYIAKILSPDPSVSSMRFVVIVCTTAALFISLDVIVMWNLWLFGIIKKPVETGSIIGLVGTLLTPLVPKAIQSFSQNDYLKPEENEEIITINGDKNEK